MRNTRTLVCSVAALLLAGCSQSDTRRADAQALKDNEAQWNRDFVSKNVDTLLAHYADNAVLMAPGMPSSSGKSEIRKTLAGMVADPAISLQFQSSRVEVAKAGDLAYTQGTFQITMTDPVSSHIVHARGSYVTTYAKQPDGSWKAVADIAPRRRHGCPKLQPRPALSSECRSVAPAL